MAKETASHINQLQPLNPDGADPKSQGDDHIRMIKACLTADFPNIGGTVTATHTELSYMAGVTSAVQTQINLKAPIASPSFTGTANFAAINVPLMVTSDASSNAASTQFVQNAIASISSINAGLFAPMAMYAQANLGGM